MERLKRCFSTFIASLYILVITAIADVVIVCGVITHIYCAAVINVRAMFRMFHVSDLVENILYVNKKYVLSNSESVQCIFFMFSSRHVHPVQNLLLCTKFHRNRMIFRRDMAI